MTPTPLPSAPPDEDAATDALRDLVTVLAAHGHTITQAEGEDGVAEALLDVLIEHSPKIAAVTCLNEDDR